MALKRMKGLGKIGLALSIVGVSIFFLSSIPVTRTEDVIDATFSLSPGETMGPYHDDTNYHTRVMVKSKLEGVIAVAGKGVRLSVWGHNAEDLEDIYIDGEYEFIIAPAKDQYTFTFHNDEGEECEVRFQLIEIWTGSLTPLLRISGLVILVPLGLIVSGLPHLSKRL